MSQRRGHSLIEILVAITLVSFLLSIVAVVGHGMFRAAGRLDDAMAHTRSLGRLALRFRIDAHQSRTAELPAEGGLVLRRQAADAEDGDEMISYRFEKSGVQRLVRRGQELRHRDSFRLPGTALLWQVGEAGNGQTVTMIVRPLGRPGRSGQAFRSEVRVTARVGRNSLQADRGDE